MSRARSIRRAAKGKDAGDARRALALGCLATVAFADWVIQRKRPPWLVIGLLDEPAHLATAALVLLNLEAPTEGGELEAGFLAGAVLPDVDHVPLLFSRTLPDVDDPRPVTHCLLAAAPLVAVAGKAKDPRVREAAKGAAAGTLAHFARDLAVGTGVALFRPLSSRSLKLPYALYAAALTALAGRAALRPGRDHPDTA